MWKHGGDVCVRIEVNSYILYIVLLSFLFVYSFYGVMYACTVKYLFIEILRFFKVD